MACLTSRSKGLDIELHFKSRKNRVGGAVLKRKCQCNYNTDTLRGDDAVRGFQCQLLCPSHALAFFIVHQRLGGPPGPKEKIFRTSYAAFRKVLSRLCVQAQICTADKVSTKSFRRGTTKEMLLSGKSPAQILVAGGWTSIKGGMMSYLDRDEVEELAIFDDLIRDSDDDDGGDGIKPGSMFLPPPPSGSHGSTRATRPLDRDPQGASFLNPGKDTGTLPERNSSKLLGIPREGALLPIIGKKAQQLEFIPRQSTLEARFLRRPISPQDRDPESLPIARELPIQQQSSREGRSLVAPPLPVTESDDGTARERRSPKGVIAREQFAPHSRSASEPAETALPEPESRARPESRKRSLFDYWK